MSNNVAGTGKMNVGVGVSMEIYENAFWKPKWKIEKYQGEAIQDNLIAIEEFEGNLLLNEGITLLLNLLIGAAGIVYNAANTRIGVGDSATAAVATQVGLLGTTNRFWRVMDATFPSVSAQTVSFRATFGTNEANFVWNEITVVNTADDMGQNLCRRVQAMGTKASGTTWVVTVTVTIS